MAANTAPIFTLTPNVQGTAVGGTANTDSTGGGTIGTNIFKCFTAGAAGSYVSKILFVPAASVPATSISATTIRVFLSNATGSTTTSANTWLVGEVGASNQFADNTTTAVGPYELPLNFAIPAGWFILVANHVVNAGNTTWIATVFGGDY